MHEIERFYRITYDSDEQKTFEGKVIEFKQAVNGL
jgi:hypothetical protein